MNFIITVCLNAIKKLISNNCEAGVLLLEGMEIYINNLFWC